MPTRFFHVDAFTVKPFSGNPAVVCPLEGPSGAAWMQNVAAEMNVSETAFLYPEADGFNLRWFTPTTEVDLCGHATLASSHVLWEQRPLDAAAPARFHTLSGLVTVTTSGAWHHMDFPAELAVAAEAPTGLAEALSAPVGYVGRNRLDYVAVLASEEAVRTLSPDLSTIAKLPGRSVIVTAKADMPGVNYVCRVFGPAVGIPEDPSTGSAQCALALRFGPQTRPKRCRAEGLRRCAARTGPSCQRCSPTRPAPRGRYAGSSAPESRWRSSGKRRTEIQQ
jgi:PhzF family phenazine biosynthesis protein